MREKEIIMKRYFAVERMPWGKKHLAPGEELIDPSPESEPVLIGILASGGRVREVSDQPARGTYATRALTAEPPARRVRRPRQEAEPEPVAEPVQQKPAASTEEAPRTGSHAVGAMTTQNTLKTSGKTE